MKPAPTIVTPAKAGVHGAAWMPAFAGMTAANREY